jgi:hypothetical protein
MTFRRRLWQKYTESNRVNCPLYPYDVRLEVCRGCADLGEIKEHGVECGLVRGAQNGN